MKATTNTGKEIVTFKIGRGGMFNNAGYLSYLDNKPISNYTSDLFLNYDLNLFFGKNDKYIDNKEEITELIHEEKFDELKEKFGIDKSELGEREYFDGSGNSTGLTESEAESGIGRIDIDGQYETYYSQYLEDCSKIELEKIYYSKGYVDANIKEYCKDKLGIEELEETE